MVWLPHLPSRMTANTVLWASGLVLQCALVLAVFSKGIARRFPAFAVILVFYPVRAAVLFALAARLDAEAYRSLFDALAFLEIPLQMLVVLELTLRLCAALGGWRRRRWLVLAGFLAVASALTWVVLRVIPEKGLADRAQVFMAAAMLALFAAAVNWARSWNLLRIADGFAAFAILQLATLAGKAHAIARHNPGAYVVWSYVPACGYLAVVIFWLAALRREGSKKQTALA